MVNEAVINLISEKVLENKNKTFINLLITNVIKDYDKYDDDKHINHLANLAIGKEKIKTSVDVDINKLFDAISKNYSYEWLKETVKINKIVVDNISMTVKVDITADIRAYYKSEKEANDKVWDYSTTKNSNYSIPGIRNIRYDYELSFDETPWIK